MPNINFIYYYFLKFIIIDICYSGRDDRFDNYVNKYNYRIPFPPEPNFPTILELRNLTYYYEAWTHVPAQDFLELVPVESYVYFYDNFKSMDSDSKIGSINKIMAAIKTNKDTKITNKDKLNEIKTLLIRYAYCLNGQDVYRNCPNPCNNAPCSNSSKCLSKVLQDDEIELSESVAKFAKIANMFKKSYYCTCSPGYFWNKKSKYCEKASDGCEIYEKTICNGLGTCLPRVPTSDDLDSFECFCLPAFKGRRCAEENNPCDSFEFNFNPCGIFPCMRDRSSLLGYTCNCSTKFKPQSDSNPICVDRDECIQDKTICQNNGICINLDGGYSCNCSKGFVGENCESDMNSVLDLKLWGSWSKWSSCSRTCKSDKETGSKIRTRECEQKYKCGNNITKHVEKCDIELPSCVPCHGQLVICLPGKIPIPFENHIVSSASCQMIKFGKQLVLLTLCLILMYAETVHNE